MQMAVDQKLQGWLTLHLGLHAL